MTEKPIKYDSLLLSAAAIWGFAFVAQRAGMEHVGPFTFNGVRFLLGCISILPLYSWSGSWSSGVFSRMQDARSLGTSPREQRVAGSISMGIAAGLVLFAGASLQQVGIVYTTAGKAGFITGLYVVIVPLLGLLFGRRPGVGSWIGAALAAAGLYLLSVRGGFSMGRGDVLVFSSSFFFAVHVLMIGSFSRRMNGIALAATQFAVCGALSLAVAFARERVEMGTLADAAIPILYGGICSVGIAYTLQVVAQRHAPATHAAIILSLEAVFAALGGWWLLGETIPPRGLAGCVLMLTSMLISQTSARSEYIFVSPDGRAAIERGKEGSR